MTAHFGNGVPGVAYSVDWGDGTSDPVQGSGNVQTASTHKYSAPGIYIVKYGVVGGAPVTVSLTVRAPVPTLSLDPNPALVGQQVTASMGNLLPSLPYSLDWGDGTTVPVTVINGKATAKHAYNAPGVFVVKLSADGVAPVTVSLNVRPPVPTLSLDPNPALVGQQVTASMGNLISNLPYSLDWGDGTTVPVTVINGKATAKHAYNAPGVFVVKLSADGVAPVTVSLNVRPPVPTLSLDPNPALVGQQVTANMGNLLPNLPYSLDWGDGTTVPVTGGNGKATAKHVYNAPGVFVVKLSADGVAPVTVSLNVRPPVPTLSVDPNPATALQDVTASLGNLIPNFPYSLDWGDGTTVPVTGNGKATAKHKYAAPGVFVVKLSADGIAPVTVSLNVRPPAAGLTVEPNPALVGQDVTANLSSLLPNYPYSLDWGDGTTVPVTGNGRATAKHKYTAPGVFVVKLSADGIAPVTVSLNVRPPAAGLTVEPNPASVGQQVTANLNSLLPSLIYTLDWGDGSVVSVSGSASASPKHAYTAPGVYLVQLSADGVTPVTVSLKVNAPQPTLTVEPNPATVGQQVTATMASLVANLNYTLDWGDGVTVPVTGNGQATASTPTALPESMPCGSAPMALRPPASA